MKVVAILGSPRQAADSTKIAEAAAQAVLGADGEFQKFAINDLSVRGCQACYACKKKAELCVIKDELAPVLAACREADYLILASPIYIGDITAQAKLFVDRTFSWFKPDFYDSPNAGRLAGKKILLVFTQGNPDPGFYKGSLFAALEGYFQRQGFKAKYVVAAIPRGPEAEAKVAEAQKEAAAAIKSL
ncbi:MAG: flavodoxin family protein [Deltaproteobacteria bacterium]|jgi:multimeric flavodoxin WrbA|nr:flavodoxin family protein [Deltaproteobacteria bacterium]